MGNTEWSYVVMEVKEPQVKEKRGSSSWVRSLSLISGIDAGTANTWHGLSTHT